MSSILVKKIKYFVDYKIFRWLSDKTVLKFYYRIFIGRKLDLEHPKGYNEKLQWLKLHDRNKEYTRLVDKYQVKQIVAEKIGKEYVVPVVAGPWKTVEEIEIDKLPDQFVLKASHDCGSTFICENKETFDWQQTKIKLKKALKANYYYMGREWPYKNVVPCIFAEQCLDIQHKGSLTDYKFLCFDGVPRIMFIVTERDKGLKVDFFDMDFRHLPIVRHYPNSQKEIGKPEHFDLMKELAAKLAQNIPHVRIDFYEIDGKVYFGEYTFYPGGGMEEFASYEDDLYLGKMITII